MAIAILKIRLMPTGVDIDLNSLRTEINNIILGFENAKTHGDEIVPVAFGLNALVVTLSWPEEFNQDDLINKLQELELVESVSVIDYRRAFG